MDNVARLFYSVETRDLERVDRLLDNIQRSANQAGREVQGIGDGAGQNIARGMDEGRRATDNFRNSVALGSSSLAGLGTVVAGIGFGGLAANAVSFSRDFQASLNDIEERLGGTTAEMNLLRETALELGATTAFSASESADAISALAAVNLNSLNESLSDTEQIVSVLPDVLALASAGQIELEAAAKFTTATLNQFQLATEDSTRVVDLLAAVGDVSGATIQGLEASLKRAGPAANAYGQTLESTAAVIALLADNSIEAEVAGTAIAGLFGRLTNAVGDGADALAEYNLSTDDFVTTNDEGREVFIGYADAIDILSNATNALTGETIKTTDVSRIFGQEAGKSLIPLVTAGGDAIREYEASFQGAASAAQQAQTRLQGLPGDLVNLNSAWQNLNISLVDNLGFNEAVGAVVRALTATLRFLADDGITFVIESIAGVQAAWANFNRELFGNVGSLDAAVSGVGGNADSFLRQVGDAIEFVTDRIRPLLPFIDDFAIAVAGIAGSSLALSGVAAVLGGIASIAFTPLSLGIAAVAAGAVLIRENWETVSDFWANLWSQLEQDVVDFDIAGILSTIIGTAVDLIRAGATRLQSAFSDLFGDALPENTTFIEFAIDAVSSIRAGLLDAAGSAVAGIRIALVNLFDSAFPNDGDFREFVTDSLVGIIRGIGSFVGATSSALKGLFDVAFPNEGDFQSFVVMGLVGVVRGIGSFVGSVGAAITRLFNEAFPNEGDFRAFITSSLVGLIRGIGSFVGETATALRKLFSDSFPDGSTFGSLVGSMLRGIGSFILNAGGVIKDVFLELFNGAFPNEGDFLALAKKIIDALVKGIADGAGAIGKAIRDLIENAIPLVGDIKDSVVGVSETVVDSISDGLDAGRDKVGDAVEDLVGSASSVISRFTPDFLRAGEDLAEGTARGIAAGQDRVAGEARQVGVVAEDALRDQTKTQSPSLIFFAIGLDIVDGLVGGIDEGRPAAVGAITSIADEMINRLDDLGEGLIETFADSVRDFDSLRDAFGDIEDFIKDWFGDIAGTFVEQNLGRLFSRGLESLGGLVGGPNGGAAGTGGGFGLGGFVQGIGDTFSGFTDSFSRIFTGFGDRITQLFTGPVNTGSLSAAASPQPVTGSALGSALGVAGTALSAGFVGQQVGELIGVANSDAVGIGTAIGTAIAGPVGAVIGGLAGSAFGGSRQQVGSGVELNISGSQVTGQSFNRFERERSLFRGTETTFTFSELDAELESSLNDYFGNLNDAIVDLVSALGVQGAESILSGFELASGRLNSEEEIAQFIEDSTRDAYQFAFNELTPGIQAIISESVDVATAPLEEIQTAFGELSAAIQVVAPQLESFGVVLGSTPTEIAINTSDLVDRLGGAEVAIPQLQLFQQEVFPEVAGQLQDQAVEDADTRLIDFSNSIGLFGDNVIDTRAELGELFLSLDQTTIAGRETAATLVALSSDIYLVEDAALAQASAMDQVTTILGRLNPAVGGLGTISQQAVDNLIEAAGGLDELAAGANSFYNNFFTPEERADFALRDATLDVINFNRQLGLTGENAIDTADEFRTLVFDLQAAAAAGDVTAAQQLATALSLSDSFALVTQSGDDLRDAIAQLPVEFQGGLNALVDGLDQSTEELASFGTNVKDEFSEIGTEALAEITGLGGGISTVFGTLGQDATTLGTEIQQAGMAISGALTPVEQAYTNVLSPALQGMAEQLRQNGQHAFAFQAIGLDEHLGALVAQGVPMSELFNDLPAEFQGIASQLGGPDGLASLLAGTSGNAFNAAENVGGFSNALNTAATTAFNAGGSFSGLATAAETAASGFSRALGRIPKTIEVPEFVLTNNNRSPFGGIRSFMTGTDFVDSDGLANIHRGEIIIDPQSSDILRRYGIQIEAPPTVDNASDQDQTGELLIDLAAEVRQFREDNARSAQIAANQRDRQRGDIQQQTGEIRELNRESRRQTATLNDAVNNGAP